MNINQQHLDSETLPESEQNGIVLQEFDEEKQRKQQEEIDDMKLRDSKDKKERIKHLTKLIKDRAEEEEPEIEQRVIDLFNQLKKEQDREEYLREYVKNYLDKTGSSYNPKEIRNLVAKYIRNCMKEDLDFENNVAWFNSSIQHLKQDIEKLIQTYMHEKMPCELGHNIGKSILESAFGEGFKLIGTSGYTGVYSTLGGDKVYKLNTLELLKSFKEGRDYCNSSKSNEKENELFQRMQEYFPEDSVLTPQNYEKTIKLDKNLTNQLEIPNVNFPKNFTFTYTITPLAKEISEGSGVGFDLNFGWGHISELMGEDFAKRFESEGVTQEELNTYIDKKFEKVIQNIKKLSNDEGKIKELLKGLIKFSDENDVVLDIYGTNNFTFYLDSNGNLKYHIIDPFMPGNLPKSKIESFKGKEKITRDNIHGRSYEYIMQKIKNYCE